MSLLDLSWVVTSLAQEEVSVRRYSFSGYDANGRPVPRTYTNFETVASVQPQAGDITSKPSEGESSDQVLHIYTPFPLKLGDEVHTSFGRAQVTVLHQRMNMGAFCKASAVLLDDQEPRP